MPFYGNQKFDPTLIWSQIFVLQSAFYLLEGVVLGGFYLLFGGHFSLDEILNWKRVSFSNTGGWVVAFSLVASSIVIAFLLVVVVERAKKCLDFSFTLFFVHFLLSWAYSVSKEVPQQ
jgi:protein SYS1